MSENFDKYCDHSLDRHRRFAETNKVLAEKWSVMTDEEKEPYNEKAKELKPGNTRHSKRTPFENIHRRMMDQVMFNF